MDVTENAALLPSALKVRPGSKTTGSEKAAADFESFLTLLTAQLRNQDPLQPIDSTEFVAQLASFSTVEQLVGANERLDALQASSASAGVAALAGWIGRDVAATDGGFRATGGPVPFTLPEVSGAESIEARVIDASGAEIARFDVTPDAEGTAYWNGRDANDRFVTDRDLRILLDFRSGETLMTQAPAVVFRKVTAVSGAGASVSLRLSDGRMLAPDAVSHIRGQPVADATASGEPLGS